MTAGSMRGTRRLMSGRRVASLVLLALAAVTGWLVGAAGALCAFAFTAAVVTVALLVLLVWAEHRQSLYRRRLSARPMHQHGGVPCHGEACRPVRESEVAA